MTIKFFAVLLFALTQTQAVNQARITWGDTAFVRATKLAGERGLVYEVGHDDRVLGRAAGSYDAAFIAALAPLAVPRVTLANPAEVFAPVFVDVDTTINCPYPVMTPFGPTPVSVGCRQREMITRYQKFVTDLCLHDVYYCEKAMIQSRVNIPEVR